MKKTIAITSALLSLVLIFCMTACGNTVDKTGIWESATYFDNKDFGSGSKTIEVEVKAEEQSVIFTIKTDKETLGEILLEHDLIAGEQGAYGLYVKTVNGMLADYDIDQSYWSFCKNGTPLNTGVDGTNIADGEHYEIVYTK